MANDNQDVIQGGRSRRAGAPFLTDDIADQARDTSSVVPNAPQIDPDAMVAVLLSVRRAAHVRGK